MLLAWTYIRGRLNKLGLTLEKNNSDVWRVGLNYTEGFKEERVTPIVSLISSQ